MNVKNPNEEASRIAKQMREEYNLGPHALTMYESYVQRDGTGTPQFRLQLIGLEEQEVRAMLTAWQSIHVVTRSWK